MNYIKENLKEFDVCNILLWHSLGYTGKGIKVANLEKCCPSSPIHEGKVIAPFGHVYSTIRNSHGDKTSNVLHQVAPDSYIYALSESFGRKGDNLHGKLLDETIPYLIENDINLVSCSLWGSNFKAINKVFEDLKQHGITLVNSAGNEGKEGLTGYSKSELWLAIGAVGYNDWGNKALDTIFLKDYSSIGKELDYVMFSGLYVHDLETNGRTFRVDGTSFAQPMFTGMLALVQQFFLEKVGRTLYENELILFINDHLIDLGETGWDEEFGHGLFVLPNPADIITSKYLLRGKEENTVDYFNDDNGRWHEKFNNRLAELGIVVGDGNGNVSPDDYITRAEVNKIVAVSIDFILSEMRKMLGK